MRSQTRGAASWVLPGAAIFAFLWAVARAATQSITIDEADTYLPFVARPGPFHWSPAANNHILNSALMRLSTSLFGLSHLTIRAPALLGAAIYIAAAYALCRILTERRPVQWIVFVCLVYNPFVFDYFVAARGYGLANAFLLSAIWLAADILLRGSADHPRRRKTRLRMASVCLGLAVAANFSFTIAAVLTGALCYGAACLASPRERLSLAAHAILPAALTMLFFCGYTAIHFPKSEFAFGAHSLRETVRSVLNDSLFELNANILNPLLLPVFRWMQPRIFPAVAVTSLISAATVGIGWRRMPQSSSRALALLSILTSAVLIFTLALDLLLFRLFQIPLPMDRTALYLAPLSAVSIAALLCFCLTLSPAARLSAHALSAALCCLALSFLFSLRLGYFREWKYDADVRQAYSVLSRLNREAHVRQIASNWRYSSALNVYCLMSPAGDLEDFQGSTQSYPPDAEAYVLHLPEDQTFIDGHHLKVVFRGDASDIVVVVNPLQEKRADHSSGGSPF